MVQQRNALGYLKLTEWKETKEKGRSRAPKTEAGKEACVRDGRECQRSIKQSQSQEKSVYLEVGTSSDWHLKRQNFCLGQQGHLLYFRNACLRSGAPSGFRTMIAACSQTMCFL